MCDKMAISAHILKIVENDPFLRLQMTAKEMLNRLMIFVFQILDLKVHFSASLNPRGCTHQDYIRGSPSDTFG